MLDIRPMVLTLAEIEKAVAPMRNNVWSERKDVAQAQLARALWGIRDWLYEEHRFNTSGPAYVQLGLALEGAGVKRPGEEV